MIKGNVIINLNYKPKEKSYSINIPTKIDKTGFVDIKGYEGLYMINREGKIISCSKVSGFLILKEKYKKPFKKANGYYQINLTKDGFKRNYYVHRLVAETFIPNPNNYPEVNHKDENPANNHVENLEWCTASYNCRYSDIGGMLRELRGDKLKITNIVTNESQIFNSKREAAYYLKGSDAGIILAIRNNSIYKRKYKIEVISYGQK